MARINKRPTKRNRPAGDRRPTGNQSFYQSNHWRKVRAAYFRTHKVCEVHLANGEFKDVTAKRAAVVDHIIREQEGGSLTDPRNLCVMAKQLHDRKSGLEAKGLINIDYVKTSSGKVPTNKSQALQYLAKVLL